MMLQKVRRNNLPHPPRQVAAPSNVRGETVQLVTSLSMNTLLRAPMVCQSNGQKLPSWSKDNANWIAGLACALPALRSFHLLDEAWSSMPMSCTTCFFNATTTRPHDNSPKCPAIGACELLRRASAKRHGNNQNDLQRLNSNKPSCNRIEQRPLA